MLFTDPQALATFRYKGAGSTMVGRLAFDQAETNAIQNVRRNPDSGTTIMQTPVGRGSVSLSTTMTARPAGGNGQPEPNAPVRVGGNVTMPTKVYNVPVVYPDAMRASGVSGIVIVEAVIARDGSVRSAQILRGLAEPLNAAALDAVKHWRCTNPRCCRAWPCRSSSPCL